MSDYYQSPQRPAYLCDSMQTTDFAVHAFAFAGRYEDLFLQTNP